MPAQHHHFQARLAVEMEMQCREIEDVVIVMSRGEPACEIALLMVEDIAQDAETVRIARRGVLAGCLANEIPHGLGAVGIAPALDELIERRGYLVGKADGDPLHLTPSRQQARWSGRSSDQPAEDGQAGNRRHGTGSANENGPPFVADPANQEAETESPQM